MVLVHTNILVTSKIRWGKDWADYVILKSFLTEVAWCHPSAFAFSCLQSHKKLDYCLSVSKYTYSSDNAFPLFYVSTYVPHFKWGFSLSGPMHLMQTWNHWREYSSTLFCFFINVKLWHHRLVGSYALVFIIVSNIRKSPIVLSFALSHRASTCYMILLWVE